MEDDFEKIGEYWSAAKNGEIWLKRKDLVPGSPQYFDQIEEGRFKYNYYMPDILKWFRCAPGRRLIEVGCGMGMDSAYFMKNGFQATCVDLAEAHVWLAKKFFEYKGISADIRLGNAESLEFGNESFDCAYSFGVLHHTRNPQNGLDEIHRILAPGGRAVIMLYHRNSLNNLVHRLLRIPYDNIRDRRPFGKDANFVYRYSRGEIRRMLSRFSQVEIKVEYAYGAGWEPITSRTPAPIYKFLSKTVGWHLVIYAKK